MSSRISARIVRSANKRLIREGKKSLSSANYVVQKDSMCISIQYRGEIISQTITSETIKTNYKKSLELVLDASQV